MNIYLFTHITGDHCTRNRPMITKIEMEYDKGHLSGIQHAIRSARGRADFRALPLAAITEAGWNADHLHNALDAIRSH